jgi:hypothetical protein
MKSKYDYEFETQPGRCSSINPSRTGINQGGLNHRRQGNAYKPRVPFKTIEGLGEEPWMRLSRNAVYVLDRLYSQFNGYNRANLSLTYDMIRKKLSGRLFSAALWELMAYGFIDRIRVGGMERKCSIYGLSNRWRRLSENPVNLEEIEALLRQVQQAKRGPSSAEKRMHIATLKHTILSMSGHRGI